MEKLDSKNRNSAFQDPDRESAHILACWLDRSGVKSRIVLEELCSLAEIPDVIASIGMKTFSQWTSDVDSGKMISALTDEARGIRVVSVVRWFIMEHNHRRQPIVHLQELRRLIELYADLPVKYRLQLTRILHEFEIHQGVVNPEKLFEQADWRHQYARWSVFGFVVDYLWCLRATNILDMELVGLERDDTHFWGWWHRLAVPVKGITKYSLQSPFTSLRGPYAQAYYLNQMKRFSLVLDKYLNMQDERCIALYKLLKKTESFEAMLEKCRDIDIAKGPEQLGVPIPFFRPDGTLLWMYELSVDIPGNQGYQLILWSPVNNDSNEYMAELRRNAIRKTKEEDWTLFIEDFAHHFSSEERLALGV